MLSQLTLLLVVISVVSCQINGEFWWLKKEVTNLKHGIVSPPKFDDVNEFDTDETAKVIFRDNLISAESEKPYLAENRKSRTNNKKSTGAIYFQDETKLTKPNSVIDDVNNNLWENLNKNINSEKKTQKYKDDDVFVFPGDYNLLWTDSQQINRTTLLPLNNKIIDVSSKTKIITQKNSIPHNDYDALHPENICKFVKKSDCIRNERRDIPMNTSTDNTICCNFSPTTPIAKIIFPDSYSNNARRKRSNVDEINRDLKQRKNLMSRKYNLDNQRVGTTTPGSRKKITHKIVNSDEYPVDPYWNIKNPSIRNPNIPFYQDPDEGYDYGSQNYGDAYASELPKPGLIGIYSDHKQTQTGWIHNNEDKGFSYDASDSNEEESETSFAYSSIDPRLGHHYNSVSSKPTRNKPAKVSGTSSMKPMQSQSQTISFHSNPDFHVLEGFKLLNLVRQRNRIVRKTPETNKCNTSTKIKEKPLIYENYSDYDADDLLETNSKQKFLNECGKTVYHEHYENEGEQGIVEFGTHPWILIVVSTKSLQNMLCYATLVHSRVALTAAKCVAGESPGAISIIAGIRNLNEDLKKSQRRMASIFLSSEYTLNNLNHNLGLLHWKRPLILDATVQPACLGDLQASDVCVFVGCIGYGQEMHSGLHWQRASILAPQSCNEHLSKLQVNAQVSALCAATKSRGTVTGDGVPLLCNNRKRWSIVGVTVWRDDVIILALPQEWIIKSMATLQIH